VKEIDKFDKVCV